MIGTSRKARGSFRFAFAVFFVLFALLAVISPGVATSSYAHALAAPKSQGQDFSQVDTTIRDLMALYDVPGVAVGLVKDGKVVYTRGYGVRSTQTSQPVTENTLFAIGSVTKSFTALDIAQQVDAGKIDLDAPVVTYLPDFKLSDPEATKQVTLRHFLSHTSGVPPTNEWYTGSVKDRKAVLDSFASVKLAAPPGKVWQYNNEGYVVAGAVLERVTGQSWEDYTRQHVFGPLAMTGANFDVAESQKSPDYAGPHALDVLKGMQPIPFFTNLAAAGPAGSINADVADMAKYAAFQVGDGTVAGVVTESTRLVSKQMLDTMHTQQILIGGPANTAGQPGVQASGEQTQTVAGAPLPTNIGYGLAWITEDYHGYKLVAHNGSIDGFSSYVTLVPSAQDGVVLLTNAAITNGGGLFLEAARLHLVNWLLGVPSEPNLTETINRQGGFDPAQFNARLQAARTYKADPSALAALAGDYPGVLGKLSVTVKGGGLYVKFELQPSGVDLVPFEPGGFLINTFPVAGSVITFKTDANGTTTVYQEGVQIAQRLGKGVQAAEYKDPKGRFTATIPPGLAVSQQGDVLVLQSANPPGIFVLAAADSGTGSLQDNVTKFIKLLDPTFNLQPADVSATPPIQGVVWTQFVYQLPSEQVLAVAATQQNGTAYFVLVQARSADLTALTPTFQSLVLGVRLGQSQGGQPQQPQQPQVPVGMPRTGEGEDKANAAASGLAAFACLLLLAGLTVRSKARSAGRAA